MKRGVIFGILIGLIINLSLVSSIPYILFVDPTPVDGYSTTSSGEFEINISLNEVDSLNELIWNWNSVNYSLYDEDLVLMYNFENNSLLGENDSLVVDLSKYGNNGSVVNGTSIIGGKYGKGYNFSNQEGIIIQNSEEFQTNNYTLSVWIKPKKKKIIDFSEGSVHTCFVDEDYSGYCYGDNYYGQLGDGTKEDRVLPKKINGYQFKQIIASMYSSCGLQLNGSVLCWGRNSYGQLGIGNTTDIYNPINLSGNYNFSILVKSHQRACGYLTNGTLMCWGDGNHGEYGDNVSGNRNVPRIIAPGYNFSKITIGEDHMCGILYNGTVLCWGGNYENQLGDNTTINRNIPGPVYGNLTFKEIGAGEDQTCGVLINGSLMCWGENQEAQLGDPITKTNGVVPVFAITSHLFDKLIIGKHIQYGNLTNGSNVAWAWHLSPSSYGDNTYDVGYFPKIVDWKIDFEKVETNLWNSPYSCGLFNDSIYCWGNSYSGEGGLGFLISIINFPIKLNLGEEFEDFNYTPYFSTSNGCFLKENGSVYCLGYNYYGQLGNGEKTTRMVPRQVRGDHNFSTLALGASSICGLLQNGSVLCWGDNTYGQLGNGTIGDYSTYPLNILGGYNFSSISSGYYHVCGFLHNGSVLCWGRNQYGQLGIGNTTDMSTPTFVLGGYNFSSISSGYYNPCGLLHNGTLICWGYNSHGQLGNGSVGGYRTIPLNVVGEYNFSSIKLGARHSCGLLQNGSAMCWGDNIYGQLGNGTSGGTSGLPKYISGENNFSIIYSGSYQNCGILSNGSALCWGINNYGQLGDGTTNNILTPKIINQNFNFSELIVQGYTLCLKINNEYYCSGYNYYNQIGMTLPFPKVPTNVYYGEIISQSQNSFKLGLTLNNSLRAVSYLKYYDYQLQENEYSNIILSSNNSNINLYINGNLIFSENNYMLYKDVLENLTIGKNMLGVIDEVRVYNRSLSASEVQQLYKTNLMKKNMTSWEFYAKESLNSGDKTYTYGLFGKDSVSVTFSLLRNIIKYSLSGGDEDNEESSSGSEFKEITLNKNSLEKGFNLNVKKNLEIEIPFNGLSENKIITVKDINPNTDEVVLTSGDEEYSLLLGEGIKIDLDNDGYYDIEIINKKNYGTISNLEFKSIYEKVPAEEQEEVIENVEENVNEEEVVSVEKENKGLKIILIGLIGVVICVGILLGHKKHKRKKRYKQFGY